MELTLIRHPRPSLPAGTCVGRLDVECAGGWEPHAERLARVLGTPDRLFTSPARRCVVLAERLGAGYRLAPSVDPRLHELDFGEWEGRRWADIGHTATQILGSSDFFDQAPPGGESYRDLMTRIDAFLAELGSTFERVAIVTHSGPIRALLVRCLELPVESGARFDVGFGRMTRLAERGGAWRLEVLNA
jgi:alpha-ribazole phosphatase